MIIAKVILPLPIRQYFKYFVPHHLMPIVGGRVIVPFGSRELIGIVISLHTFIGIDIVHFKYIRSVIDHESIFNKAVLDLLIWFSNYYFFPIGSIFFYVLPKFFHADDSVPQRFLYQQTLTDKGLKINLKEYEHINKQSDACLLLEKNSIFDDELQKNNVSTSISTSTLNSSTNQKLCIKKPLFEECINISCVFSIKKKFF